MFYIFLQKYLLRNAVIYLIKEAQQALSLVPFSPFYRINLASSHTYVIKQFLSSFLCPSVHLRIHNCEKRAIEYNPSIGVT